MTNDRIRIKIAERCGWRHEYDTKRLRAVWISPKSGYAYDALEDMCPDYPSDLNAMHEAEGAIIEPYDIEKYSCELYQVLERFWTPDRWMMFSRYGIDYAFAHATAIQRAEAFLRTFGDWEDGEGETGSREVKA